MKLFLEKSFVNNPLENLIMSFHGVLKGRLEKHFLIFHIVAGRMLMMKSQQRHLRDVMLRKK
jgi:hypothetical protein